MNSLTKAQRKEAQTLAQALWYDIISLAVSTKGKLSSAEEDTLSRILQTQMNLRILLDQATPNSTLCATDAWQVYEILTTHAGTIHAALVAGHLSRQDALVRYALIRSLRPGIKIVVCAGSFLSRSLLTC